MNLTFKETGRLTIRMFCKLYQHYKDDFDLETMLRSRGMTYAEIKNKNEEKEWF